MIFDNNKYINKNINIYINNLLDILPKLNYNIINKIIGYYSIYDLKKNNLLVNNNFVNDYNRISSYYYSLTKKFIENLNIGMKDLKIFDHKRSNWMLYDEVTDLEDNLDCNYYKNVASLKFKINWVSKVLHDYVKNLHIYDLENLFEKYIAPNNYKYEYFQDIYLIMKFNKFIDYQRYFNKDILLIIQSYLIDEYIFLDLNLKVFNNNKVKNNFIKIFKMNNIKF